MYADDQAFSYASSLPSSLFPPLASRLSPLASRLSPTAYRLAALTLAAKAFASSARKLSINGVSLILTSRNNS